MNIYYSDTTTKLKRNLLFELNTLLKFKLIVTNSIKNNKIKTMGFSNLINLNLFESLYGIYPNIESYPPVDRELFKLIENDAFFILEMMDRLSDFSGLKNFHNRSEMLFNHLRYWNAIIEQNNLQLAIFLDVPHEPHDYIVYLLMKSKGLGVIIHEQLHFDDLYKIDNVVESKLKNNNYINNGKSFEEEINSYISEIYQERYKPFYMEKKYLFKRNYENFKSIIFSENFKKLITPKYLFYKLNKAIKHLQISRFINKRIADPDLKKDYVFIPLNYQPERTTSPQGGLFTFQELMIQMLQFNLPENWTIYVKEHPDQNLTFGRSLGFYKRILRYPNVQIVSNSFSSKELMINSKVLATVTGSMGLEALLYEKPVFIFGEIYYSHLTGAFKINSNKDLNKAFSDVSSAFTFNKKNVIDSLKKININIYKGYTDEFYEIKSKYKFDENIKNLAFNIFENIKSKKIIKK